MREPPQTERLTIALSQNAGVKSFTCHSHRSRNKGKGAPVSGAQPALAALRPHFRQALLLLLKRQVPIVVA